MLWVQKWLFFPPLFLGIIGQENVFNYILERKHDFLAIKRCSKSRKIDIFPNGFYGFGPNMAIFPSYFFRQ